MPTKHAELNEKLMDIRHLSYKDAHKEMVKEELDVKSILTNAKDEYRQLLDNGTKEESNYNDQKND